MKNQLIIWTIVVIIVSSVFLPIYSQEQTKTFNVMDESRKIYFQDKNLEGVIRERINKPTGAILLYDVKNIKKLDLSNNGIYNLSGIEDLIELQQLNLSRNKIKNIEPLGSLHKLKYLNLWSNRVEDISVLENNINLEILDLDSNNIEDISSLENLIGLSHLRLGSNRIKDISRLERLSKLEYLCLWSNRIENITSLKNLRNLKELRLAYNDVFDISSIGFIEGLESLNLFHNQISSIDSLKNLKNIRELYLMDNNISNIEALFELRNLERLKLDSNRIEDVNPIKNLGKLNLLSLSSNNIEKIEAIKSLTNIEYIELNNNNIKDIEPLKELDKLNKIFLNNNDIKDITPLVNSKKLVLLSAKGNNISDIKALEQLTNLLYLDVSHNRIEDLKPLKNLRNAKWLYLNNNNISDITPLLGLENVDTAKTYGNPIGKCESFSDYIDIGNGITINGKITDVYGDEKIGNDTRVSLVRIKDPDYRVLTTVADRYGEFIINGAQPGEYKITFTKKNYKPLTMYRELGKDKETIDVKIEEHGNVKWNRKNTERIIFNYRAGMEVSNEEVEILEKRLRDIEEFFGVTLDQKINYYICTYPKEVYELAYGMENKTAIGTYVFKTDSIYTINDTMDFHEITHGVEYIINPNYNISLGEGLAVFFGEGEIGSPIVLDRPLEDISRELVIKNEFKNINDILTEFQQEEDYIISGSLVTFLLKEYSIDQFKELFKKLPRNPNKDEIEMVIEEVYNISTEQLNIEWLIFIGMKLSET